MIMATCIPDGLAGGTTTPLVLVPLAPEDGVWELDKAFATSDCTANRMVPSSASTVIGVLDAAGVAELDVVAPLSDSVTDSSEVDITNGRIGHTLKK